MSRGVANPPWYSLMVACHKPLFALIIFMGSFSLTLWDTRLLQTIPEQQQQLNNLFVRCDAKHRWVVVWVCHLAFFQKDSYPLRWSNQTPAKITLNNMCIHESATKINWYFINLHDETRVECNSIVNSPNYHNLLLGYHWKQVALLSRGKLSFSINDCPSFTYSQ